MQKVKGVTMVAPFTFLHYCHKMLLEIRRGAEVALSYKSFLHTRNTPVEKGRWPGCDMLMKITCTLIALLCISCIANAQHTISVCAWNLENFGKSKTDSTIAFVAATIKGFDIIAIEEVVAGPGGVQAVAKLSDALNRMGEKWDYAISNPTVSSSYKTERYAFVWKTSKVKKIGEAWLEKRYNIAIDREPYYATFKAGDKTFTLVAFHAITKAMQPETEIKYFKFLPALYPGLNLMFAGDFNCPQSHTVFNPLKKMGYLPILIKQKTSLKQACVNDECLASEFDNMFYDSSKVAFIAAGILPFYTSFASLKQAREVSDHVPVYFTFKLVE